MICQWRHRNYTNDPSVQIEIRQVLKDSFCKLQVLCAIEVWISDVWCQIYQITK